MTVRVTPDGLLEIETRDGCRVAAPLAKASQWPSPIAACRARSGRSALVGGLRHDTLALVTVDDCRVRRCAIGERIANAEQLQIAAVERGFLVIHENGVASIDETARELWRVDRVTFDWRFVDERDGVLWLADHDGNLLGFDAATGFERA